MSKGLRQLSEALFRRKFLSREDLALWLDNHITDINRADMSFLDVQQVHRRRVLEVLHTGSLVVRRSEGNTNCWHTNPRYLITRALREILAMLKNPDIPTSEIAERVRGFAERYDCDHQFSKLGEHLKRIGLYKLIEDSLLVENIQASKTKLLLWRLFFRRRSEVVLGCSI